jgi:hypothetical protein
MSQAAKTAVVLQLSIDSRVRVPGHRVGGIVDCIDGKLIVDYPGNPHGPLAARTTVPLPLLSNENEQGRGTEVLLVFEEEWSDRPIVVGLLEPNEPTEHHDQPPAPLEAVVDGSRVVIEGREEIVLRCGQASITLRKNGRVVVRGTYVETRSRGVNRIKGGTVQIN